LQSSATLLPKLLNWASSENFKYVWLDFSPASPRFTSNRQIPFPLNFADLLVKLRSLVAVKDRPKPTYPRAFRVVSVNFKRGQTQARIGKTTKGRDQTKKEERFSSRPLKLMVRYEPPEWCDSCTDSFGNR
jgi:hypothetical protein